ncbi:MAG: hypothetical protein FWG87_14790 [Defluviitaleaceae bacterium]|nr:hypothetical protein [Defluviitaleaceae bacterium]
MRNYHIIPRNQIAVESTRQTHERKSFVGDGFIRPEITSLCFNGRCPSPN